MRFLKLLIAFTLFPVLSFGQIPNPSFENWTHSLLDDWIINSSPPFLTPVSSDSDAHTGSFSVRCEIVDDVGIPFGPFITPVSAGLGFPYTQYDTVLYGFYKSGLIGSNLGLIEVWIYDSLLNPIGSGSVYLPETTDFTEFALPITYDSASIPAEMSIIIQMTDTAGSAFNIGSYFLLDDLSFTHTSTVNIESPKKQFYSIAKNPVSNELKINWTEKDRFSQVSLYDLTGRKIFEKTFNGNNSFSAFDVSSLKAGCYLLTIINGRNSSTEKIMIVH